MAYRQRDLSSWRPLRVCRWQRSRAVPAQFRYFRFHQSEALRTYLLNRRERSEEHTSELQSLMRISYAVFCLKKQIHTTNLRQTLPVSTISNKITTSLTKS